MRIFKYMQQEHLDGFFQNGCLKIGTLYDYRKEEEYGEVTGDRDEAYQLTELRTPDDGLDLATNTAEAVYVKKRLCPDEQSVGWKFSGNVTFVYYDSAPDAYVYCLTSKYSPAVMKKFKYDACMEILDLDAFLASISRKIADCGIYVYGGKVLYMNRRTPFTEPLRMHPSIIKDPKYSYQKEWRSIWRPSEQSISPFLTHVPEAIRYCRVHFP
jgi:hypothetical protein